MTASGDIASQAKTMANELLRKLEQSDSAITLPVSDGAFVMRWPPESYSGKTVKYVRVPGLENVLKALVHLVHGEEQKVAPLLQIAMLREQWYDAVSKGEMSREEAREQGYYSSEGGAFWEKPLPPESIIGDGVRFHKALSGRVRDGVPGQNRKSHWQWNEIEFTGSEGRDRWFITKTHALAAAIYSRWKDPQLPPLTSLVQKNGVFDPVNVADARAIEILTKLERRASWESWGGLNHSVHNDEFCYTDTNLIYQDCDANAMVALALAVSGHYDLALERVKNIDEQFKVKGVYLGRKDQFEPEDHAGRTFDSALVGIAKKAAGDFRGAAEIADLIEARNEGSGAVNTYLHLDPAETYFRGGVRGTAMHAILLGMLGDRQKAFERAEAAASLISYEPTPGELGVDGPTGVGSVLYAALALSDLSRKASFFDSKVLAGATTVSGALELA